MTSLATRSPLHVLTMATTQRPPKRRSLRSAGYSEDETVIGVGELELPNAKRTKRVAADDGRLVNGRDAGAGVEAATARKKKQRPTYDEDDDGFTFTRTRSKRAKPPAAPVAPEPEPVEKAAPKRRKKSFSTPLPEEKKTTAPRRRSTRNSGEVERGEQSRGVNVAKKEPDAEVARRAASGPGAAVEVGKDTTTIALPFSDTPIIKRNKEFRQNQSIGRRSSIGLRGRRASSLIDSGSNALPHDEVEVTEFYKHIAADGLPEPRRMKQLLTWCGTRALGDKPSFAAADGNARLAARVIQEELLRDFSNRSEMSDWFARDDAPPARVVKKSNPRNVANAAKIQELEKQLQRLQEEKEAWEALTKPPAVPPAPDPADAFPSVGAIDRSLLDPEQAAILSSLESAPSITTETRERLKTIAAGLEFKVDRFADGVHRLGQYQATAERIAERVLALSAQRLQRREEEGLERAGTRAMPMQEVLRALADLTSSAGRR
ncbi:MAG: hypothetical protein M1832_000383 [Thelocarpon impressellum]|nr:MAG: hypothetical protein M1832_000383 [Thelocarpon impressellum]